MVSEIQCSCGDRLQILDNSYSDILKSKSVQEGMPRRVSDMYIGRYGILGYVERNDFDGRANVGGCIEIPGSLVKAIKNVPGMEGYLRDVVFGKQDFTNKKENMNHPSLSGAKLFDSEYYWHPLGYRSLDIMTDNNCIDDFEYDVRYFIIDFETVLDRFVRQDSKPNMQALLTSGVKGVVETYLKQ